MIGLDRPAALDIPEHRCGNGGLRRGEHASGELAGRFAGREPLRRRDRAALVEKRGRQVDGAGGDDVAESRPHQAGDAGGGGDEHPLVPHLLQDRVAQARLEAGARKCRRDGLAARRYGAVLLAECHAMDVVEMADVALGAERRRDHA